MADTQRLAQALKNADAAGDTQAASRIAQAIRQTQAEQEPEKEGFVTPNGPDPISTKVLQGATFGFADEIIGGLVAPGRMLLHGETLSEGFQNGRKAFLGAEKFAEENHPTLSTVAEVGGALATGGALARGGLLASTRLAPQAGLGARTGAAALDGAIAGAAVGAGNSDGLEGRASGAVSGGLTGAAIGGAIPAAGDVIKGVASPVINSIKARINPQGFATQKISERLANDGTDLAQVQRRLSNGQNIADTAGNSTRDLLRTSTNIAGNARNQVTTSLTLRQIGQGDRLKSAISRTFADPDSFLTVKDELAESARAAAKPLYEKAYAKPVPFSFELEKILDTSAGKAALRKASQIASNEQVPFAQWFANIADDGTTTIKRVPDMRAWDYIKRGLDDVIDGQTDNLTGKVTNQGRAVVGLKNRLLSHLDEANPDYGKARKAYAGAAQIDEALEFGKNSNKLSPEAVRRKVSSMSAAEKEAARIGAAETLRKSIDDSGFTTNAIRRIMGNRSQFQRLRALFDNPSQFKAFRKEIFSEARKQKTFEAVRGNSSTARQLADMQDAGGLQEAGGLAADAAQGNVGRVISGIGNIIVRAGGLTPEVADNIGRQLTTTNPSKVNNLMAQLQNIERAQMASSQKSKLIQDAISRVTINQTVPALSGQ